MAATRAKVTHQELSLRSPSIISLYGEDGMAGSKRLSHAGSLDSLIGAASSLEEGNLSSVARDLVCYISEKLSSVTMATNLSYVLVGVHLAPPTGHLKRC